jgi:hypothetical protein
MQNDDNTECSDHDAANMTVKAIEPTPIQRMRSVTQCKTVQPNTLDFEILYIIFIHSVQSYRKHTAPSGIQGSHNADVWRRVYW